MNIMIKQLLIGAITFSFSSKIAHGQSTDPASTLVVDGTMNSSAGTIEAIETTNVVESTLALEAGNNTSGATISITPAAVDPTSSTTMATSTETNAPTNVALASTMNTPATVLTSTTAMTTTVTLMAVGTDTSSATPASTMKATGKGSATMLNGERKRMHLLCTEMEDKKAKCANYDKQLLIRMCKLKIKGQWLSAAESTEAKETRCTRIANAIEEPESAAVCLNSCRRALSCCKRNMV